MAQKLKAPRKGSLEKYSGLGITRKARKIRDKVYTVENPLMKRSIQKFETSADEHWVKFRQYRYDIPGYAKAFFDVTLSHQQKVICDALIKHKLVTVRASHSVGKSYLLGILINWFFDCVSPGIGIVTAPTQNLIEKVAFGYARHLRSLAEEELGNFWKGPAIPLLESSPTHYVAGIATSDPTSMQGRHSPNFFGMVDEAVGVDIKTWEALESLLIGDCVYCLAIANPTNPSSYFAHLEKQKGWYNLSMSAYDHENIWTGVENLMKGKDVTENLQFPGAISLKRFEQLLLQWSTPIEKQDYHPERDIILPSSLAGSELVYLRPGPIAEARLLGRWPDVSMNTIFTDYDIDKAEQTIIESAENDEPIIGLDVARYGSDFSSWCVRIGGKIIKLLEINGLSVTEVASRTIEIAKEIAQRFNIDAETIPICVDGIGVGAGVVDVLADMGMNVYDINVGERAFRTENYANLRTELWFTAQEYFRSGKISLRDIDGETQRELRKQLTSPLFGYDVKARQKIETKDATVKRVQRSPDMADAVILSFALIAEELSGITIDWENKESDE